MTIADGKSSLVPVRLYVGEGADADLTPEKTQAVLRAIDSAWNAGVPWALSAQSKLRRASLHMTRDFGFEPDKADEALDIWVRSGLIKMDILSAKEKLRGLRLTSSTLFEGVSHASAFD